MRQQALSLELELPEFPYGSVWVVGAGDGDPHHLSPLAVYALRSADAVIHRSWRFHRGLSTWWNRLTIGKRARLIGRLDGRSTWLRTAGGSCSLSNAIRWSAPSNAPRAVQSRKFPSASYLVQARRLVARPRSRFCSCANRPRSAAGIRRTSR